jgi:serine/threonine protein kinase
MPQFRRKLEVEHDAEAGVRNNGLVRLDRYELKRLRLAQGLTVEEFVRLHDGEINKRTASRVFRGEPVQLGVAKFIQSAFGVQNLLDIVDPDEYTRPGEVPAEKAGEGGLSEWIEADRPGPVQTASNGLQYRVYKLRHRYEPTRIGRGKRYELFHLPSDEQQRLRERLLRHLQVCDRVCGSPLFPACYGTFPEQAGNVWWVIERWVEGRTLEDALNAGPLAGSRLAAVMTALGEALEVLHAADVVRRELSPSTVLLPDDGPDVMLTDFELAKLTDRGPTVSTVWPVDPYRAPEVATGDVDVRADLYSWARILVHAVAGRLPSPGEDEQLLETAEIPRPVIRVAKQCLARPRSRRPKDIAVVLRALRRWG